MAKVGLPQFTVSTHSRAEAAANKADNGKQAQRSFNTQPRGGGCRQTYLNPLHVQRFQHTAARRRLLAIVPTLKPVITGFNTQPRGGGCIFIGKVLAKVRLFQHTAARRRLH